MKINQHTRHQVYWLGVLLVIVIGIVIPAYHQSHTHPTTSRQHQTSKATHKSAQHNNSHMRTPIDYRQPSETIPYPDLKKAQHLWIKVLISKNRAYVYSGRQLIYTMYCSAGKYHRNAQGKKVSYTPTGTYAVQSERGLNFYNPREGCGANYYVSWRDHGKYLFHTVPTDKNGHYIPSEAAKLGKSTGSHGCVRLSIPDAKWLYDSLPVNTKVVIKP